MSFRIAFVHAPDPVYSETQSYGAKFMSVWPFVLAAHIPEGKKYDMSFYDLRFDFFRTIKEADLYLFSGINQDHHTLVETWKALKAKYPRAKSMIGGPIAWSFGQAGDLDQLKDFDHIFIGDGEDKIGELVASVESGGKLPHIVQNPVRFDLIRARPMHRAFLQQTLLRYYGQVIEVSRGCPFLCEFCDIRIMDDNNRAHTKSPDLIAQEVEYGLQHGKLQFVFGSDNFIGDQVWAEKVVDKLLELKVRTGKQPKIYTWLTITLAQHPRLMKKMREAGFEMFLIGVESFNVDSLIETAKVQNTKRSLVDDIKLIQSYGFIVVAGLIFGFDTDDEDCFEIALNGIRDSGLLSGDPSFLTALPGTPLYRRIDLSGRLRRTFHKTSSTSTGGVKYQTNIRYLLSKEKMIAGFRRFVTGYIDGKFQFERLKNYFENLRAHNNFVPLDKGESGFGSFWVVLKMIFKNPKSLYLLVLRAIFSFSNPVTVYYGLKGVFYVMRQTDIPGRTNQLQFWLFSWSNYIMKYKFLKDSEIDIDSVPADFDYNKLIPPNYRDTAQEKIPAAKIDAQVNSTIKGLERVLQKRAP